MAKSVITPVDGDGPFASISALKPPNNRVYGMLQIAIFIARSKGKMPKPT
jgi:hypothetical protein